MLKRAIEGVFKYGDVMLAEQFVCGVENSVPVVDSENPEVYPIIDENDNPYVIKINTIPGMTATSFVPNSARHLGIEFPQSVDKIVKLALNKE